MISSGFLRELRKSKKHHKKEKSVMGKEFIRTHHLELTKGELIYLLFRKKECPKCKSNLERKKEYEIRNDLGHRPNRHSIHTPGTDVKVYKYFFVCIQCSSQFPLGVLAKM